MSIFISLHKYVLTLYVSTHSIRTLVQCSNFDTAKHYCLSIFWVIRFIMCMVYFSFLSSINRRWFYSRQVFMKHCCLFQNNNKLSALRTPLWIRVDTEISLPADKTTISSAYTHRRLRESDSLCHEL